MRLVCGRPHLSLPGRATTAVVSAAVSMAALVVAAPVDAAAPLPPELGSAGSFAVLGGSPSVSSEGASSVTGELGIDPWPTVKGFPPGTVTGTIHRADILAGEAKRDLAAAYAAAAAAAPTSRVAGGALGSLTLPAGVYRADVALGLAGTVVLDAKGDPNAVWILQAGSDLVTSAGSVVRLADGGRSCNVYWQVAGSATLGAGSTFVGTILAADSIAAGSGVSVDGRLLARDGGVSLVDDAIQLPRACPAELAARQAGISSVPTGDSQDLPVPASAKGRPAGTRATPAALLAALLAWVLAAMVARPVRRPNRRVPDRRHGLAPADRLHAARPAAAGADIAGAPGPRSDGAGADARTAVGATDPRAWERRLVAYTRPAIALLMSLLNGS